jgi:hypothetical protein
MMTFDLVLVVSLIYTSLVVGSMFKFIDTGVTGKNLLWVPILPFFLMILHIIMFMHSMVKGKIRFAFIQLIFPIVKFPLVVIFFVEIIMEHTAMIRSAEKYQEIERLKKIRTSQANEYFVKIKSAIRNMRNVINGFEERERGLVRKIA